MAWQEGIAFIADCPRCHENIIKAQCEGLLLRLSRFSVPVADAEVFSRYARLVYNVWLGVPRNDGRPVLYVSAWSHVTGKPTQGRLYIEHICGARP